jgi:hypothetical protein
MPFFEHLFFLKIVEISEDSVLGRNLTGFKKLSDHVIEDFFALLFK